MYQPLEYVKIEDLIFQLWPPGESNKVIIRNGSTRTTG